MSAFGATDEPTTGRTEIAKTKKGKRPSDAPQSEASYLSSGERRAKGTAVRDAVPRESQAGWKPAKGRRDPIKLLVESNAGRVQNLIPIRFGRTSESPFAFYRGSAVLMAADLARTPTSGLRVQACGDAGCVAESRGGIEYQRCGAACYRAAFQGNNLVYVVVQP